MIKSNFKYKYKKIAIVVVLLLCFCLVGLFLVESHSEKKMDGRSTVQKQVQESVDWNSLKKVTLNRHKYWLLHDVTSWLVIGTDNSGNQNGIGKEYQGAMADFVLLVVINEESHTYGMLQLNRDTITDIALLDHNGEGEATAKIQLCTAHWYGENRQQGCENTLNAVSKLLGGIPIDGYYELPMKAIPVLNSQIGGVTVTLEDDFTSVDHSMKKGETLTLNDEQAFHYTHDRYGVGDEENTSRMKRQHQYVIAFGKKVQKKYGNDKKFGVRLLNKLGNYAVASIDNKQIVRYMQSMDDFKFQGVLNLEGHYKLGTALGDGLEHTEFYPDATSIEDIVTSLYPLKRKSQ